LVAIALLLPTLLLLDTHRHATVPHRAEWLEAAGLRWRAVRGGDGDTTLVLLHGYGEHLLTWRGVFDSWARQFRVMAVDLPGFGASDKPDAPYSLDTTAARVRALLDRWTEGPLVLVGHSMGGAVAAAVALGAPQRVVAIVLIAPAGVAAGLGEIRTELGTRGFAAIGWWESLRAFVTPMHDPTWLKEPPAMAAYDPLVDPAYRRATARVLRDFNFEAPAERLRELHRPVLLIWGRQDPVIPFAAAERFLDLLPCARLAALNTLHRPQAERPDTVAALVLGFLRRPACDA
jgi:pimeloyl-ACP methyl ester carboxylesterase